MRSHRPAYLTNARILSSIGLMALFSLLLMRSASAEYELPTVEASAGTFNVEFRGVWAYNRGTINPATPSAPLDRYEALAVGRDLSNADPNTNGIVYFYRKSQWVKVPVSFVTTNSYTQLSEAGGQAPYTTVAGGATPYATLTAAIDATITSFTVTASAGSWGSAPYVLSVDREWISCNTLAGNTFSNCTRGFNNTNNFTHSLGARVALNSIPVAATASFDTTLQSTTLSGAINNTVTTIPVNSVAGFSPPYSFKIEKELVNCTGVSGNSFTGCQRGWYTSGSAAHAAGAALVETMPLQIESEGMVCLSSTGTSFNNCYRGTGTGSTAAHALNAPLVSRIVTVPGGGTASFPATGYIRIDQEWIYYSGKSNSTFYNTTRAYNGTAITRHLNNTSIQLVDFFSDRWAANQAPFELNAVSGSFNGAYGAVDSFMAVGEDGKIGGLGSYQYYEFGDAVGSFTYGQLGPIRCEPASTPSGYCYTNLPFETRDFYAVDMPQAYLFSTLAGGQTNGTNPIYARGTVNGMRYVTPTGLQDGPNENIVGIKYADIETAFVITSTFQGRDRYSANGRDCTNSAAQKGRLYRVDGRFAPDSFVHIPAADLNGGCYYGVAVGKKQSGSVATAFGNRPPMVVWIAASNGLYRYDEETGVFGKVGDGGSGEASRTYYGVTAVRDVGGGNANILQNGGFENWAVLGAAGRASEPDNWIIVPTPFGTDGNAVPPCSFPSGNSNNSNLHDYSAGVAAPGSTGSQSLEIFPAKQYYYGGGAWPDCIPHTVPEPAAVFSNIETQPYEGQSFRITGKYKVVFETRDSTVLRPGDPGFPNHAEGGVVIGCAGGNDQVGYANPNSRSIHRVTNCSLNNRSQVRTYSNAAANGGVAINQATVDGGGNPDWATFDLTITRQDLLQGYWELPVPGYPDPFNDPYIFLSRRRLNFVISCMATYGAHVWCDDLKVTEITDPPAASRNTYYVAAVGRGDSSPQPNIILSSPDGLDTSVPFGHEAIPAPNPPTGTRQDHQAIFGSTLQHVFVVGAITETATGLPKTDQTGVQTMLSRAPSTLVGNIWVGTGDRTTGSELTALSANIDNSVTTIPVSSVAGFPASGTIRIDDEAINYTALNASPPQFLGATRGYLGTLANAHASGTPVSVSTPSEGTGVVSVSCINSKFSGETLCQKASDSYGISLNATVNAGGNTTGALTGRAWFGKSAGGTNNDSESISVGPCIRNEHLLGTLYPGAPAGLPPGGNPYNLTGMCDVRTAGNTYLTADINASTTTIPVESTADWAGNGLRVDGEVMTITVTNPTSFTVSARGAAGVPHSSGSLVQSTQSGGSSNWRYPFYNGGTRRCWADRSRQPGNAAADTNIRSPYSCLSDFDCYGRCQGDLGRICVTNSDCQIDSATDVTDVTNIGLVSTGNLTSVPAKQLQCGPDTPQSCVSFGYLSLNATDFSPATPPSGTFGVTYNTMLPTFNLSATAANKGYHELSGWGRFSSFSTTLPAGFSSARGDGFVRFRGNAVGIYSGTEWVPHGVDTSGDGVSDGNINYMVDCHDCYGNGVGAGGMNCAFCTNRKKQSCSPATDPAVSKCTYFCRNNPAIRCTDNAACGTQGPCDKSGVCTGDYRTACADDLACAAVGGTCAFGAFCEAGGAFRCDQYGVNLSMQSGQFYGFAWSEDFGWMDFRGSGRASSRYFQTKLGSILAGGNVGDPNQSQPSGINNCNATFLIVAGQGKTIANNWCSALGASAKQNATSPVNLPDSTNYFTNALGRIDVRGLTTNIGGNKNKYGSSIITLTPNAADNNDIAAGMEATMGASNVLGGRVFYSDCSAGGCSLKNGALATSLNLRNTVTLSTTGSGAGLLYVKGDLTIKKKMQYDNTVTATDPRGLASLVVIVEGNLTIENAVDQIVGAYYVFPDAVREAVSPGTTGFFRTSDSTSNDDLAPLKSYGLIIAKQFVFGRRFAGTVENPKPSELFVFDGRLQTNPIPGLVDFARVLPAQVSQP